MSPTRKPGLIPAKRTGPQPVPMSVTVHGEPGGPMGVREYGPFVMAPYAKPAPARRAAPTFADYFGLIYRRRFTILALALVCTAGSYLVTKRIAPMYEAELTIGIDREPPPRIIGPDWIPGAPTDLDQFIATQIHLIQSDPVLRPVAAKFGLTEQPKAGKAGGPVSLRTLKVSRPASTYLIQVSYRDHDAERAAAIANAVGTSYIEQLDTTRLNSWRGISSFTRQRLEELKGNMERSAGAVLAMERSLGMVDPEDKNNVVTSKLQQLNMDMARAEADRASKEAAYQTVRSGSEEALPASPQAEALRRILERRNEGLQKFSDLKAVYGDGHPEYRRSAAQLKELEEQVTAARREVGQRVEAEYREAKQRESNMRKEFDQAKAESDRVMAGTVTYQLLKHKADADRTFYDEFVRKLGEAEINAGVQKSGVRIAEMARPPEAPVSPNVKVAVGGALVGSLLLGCGFVVLVEGMKPKLRRLDEVRSAAGNEILGALPGVSAWRSAALEQVVDTGQRRLLSNDRPTAVSMQAARFEEAVRMLRASAIARADEREVRTLMVASPRGGEGRSTVAAHLAVACAGLGLKTLLIDTDLRKPSLHRLFPLGQGAPAPAGLAEVLRGEARWQDVVIRHVSKPMLHLIPAGRLDLNGSELLHRGLRELLDDVERYCDLVILDSPPFLESAQAVEVARCVHSVLLVTRSGQSDVAGLESTVEYLNRLRVDVLGVAVNDLAG